MHPSQQEPDPGSTHEADVRLVEAVLAGSETAWHAFIDRYTGLILHVLRRYLFDEDQVRNAYVDVLENLHDGRLRTYAGRSSLATWLLLVARNAATDSLRHEYGRRELPRGLRRLPALHQETYRLYYVEGCTFPATRRRLRLLGHDLDDGALVDVLGEIDAQVSDRTCRRLRYDLAAESLGAASGRLLEYCDAVHLDGENHRRRQDPLDRLIVKEAEIRALKVLRHIADLPAEDQLILSLRFEQGLGAEEIAAQLGLGSRRRAFTVIDRILRTLRRRHREAEIEAEKSGNSGPSAVSPAGNPGGIEAVGPPAARPRRAGTD